MSGTLLAAAAAVRTYVMRAVGTPSSRSRPFLVLVYILLCGYILCKDCWWRWCCCCCAGCCWCCCCSSVCCVALCHYDYTVSIAVRLVVLVGRFIKKTFFLHNMTLYLHFSLSFPFSLVHLLALCVVHAQETTYPTRPKQTASQRTTQNSEKTVSFLTFF